MNKGVFTVVVCLLLLLTSCASVPQTIVKNGVEKAQTETEKELETSVDKEEVNNILANIPEHLEYSIESDKIDYIINAQVIKPAVGEILSGNLIPRNVDANEIAKVCFGERASTMTMDNNGQYTIADPDDIVHGTDKAAAFTINNGFFLYTDYALDQQYADQIELGEIQAPDCSLTPTEAMAQASSFLDQLGVSGVVAEKAIAQQCRAGNKKGYYQVICSLGLNDIAFSRNPYAQYSMDLGGIVSIGDAGIIDIRGTFFVDVQNPVLCSEMIPLEKALSMLEKQINQYLKLMPTQEADEVNFDRVSLKYYNKINEDNTVSFFPVWYFQSTNETEDWNELYVNAQTGELES
jgi:hypothetical protein